MVVFIVGVVILIEIGDFFFTLDNCGWWFFVCLMFGFKSFGLFNFLLVFEFFVLLLFILDVLFLLFNFFFVVFLLLEIIIGLFIGDIVLILRWGVLFFVFELCFLVVSFFNFVVRILLILIFIEYILFCEIERLVFF